MRRQLLTYCAAAVGIAAISISSVVIYQQVTTVQVVTTPPPVIEVPAPSGAWEPMPTEPFTPQGRLPSMPRTGRE